MSQRVLHVTESFGGGVAIAVHDYAQNARDCEHHLAYAGRDGLPTAAPLLDPFVSSTELSRSREVFSQMRRTLRTVRPDVVHAHSSWAGVLVRICVSSRSTPIVYTPHCYAFMRQDVARGARRVFRAVEAVMLANTAAVAACSPIEAAVSVRRWSNANVAFVCNVASASILSAPSIPPGAPPSLVGVGRLAPQKDPQFFLRAYEACKRAGVAERARWIGDGDPEERRRLVDAGVEVTGWLERESVVELLAQGGQVYLHSAAWEGFPVALLEASSLKVPAIVRDIPSLRGFEFPLSCRDPWEVPAIVSGLTESDAWERAVGRMSRVLSRYDADRQRSSLQDVYARVVAQRH